MKSTGSGTTHRVRNGSAVVQATVWNESRVALSAGGSECCQTNTDTYQVMLG